MFPSRQQKLYGGGNMIYSYSRIKKYDPDGGGCPDRFHRVYILGEKEPANEPMTFGKATHSGVELILKNKMGIAEAAIAGALEAEQETGIYVRPDEVMNLLKWLPKIESTAIIEQEILIPLGNDPFAPKVRFIPDVLISGGEIIDWKSGWGASDPMQLKVYAYLANKAGYPINKARIINLGTPKRNQEIEIDQLQLDEAEIWLLEHILAIENSLERLFAGEDPATVFPPRANQYCASCSKFEECAAASVDKVLSEEQGGQNEIETLEEAQGLGNSILQIESLIDIYKGRLKKYIEKHGEVPVGTKKFGFIKSVSWGFGGKELKALMEELEAKHKINCWDYLDFGASSRKNLTKKLKFTDEQVEELLVKYGKPKVGKQFKCVALDSEKTGTNIKKAI